jgi:hypothetical protein
MAMANYGRRAPQYFRWEYPSKCRSVLASTGRHSPNFMSQSWFSSFDDHAFSSSPPRRQSSKEFVALSSTPDSSTASSSTAGSPAEDKPWDPAWWVRFPDHIMASSSGERSWWWRHGYRLFKADESLPLTSRYVWVCKIFMAKGRPPPTVYYKFIASNGRSILRYLRDHRIGHRGVDLHLTSRSTANLAATRLPAVSPNIAFEIVGGRHTHNPEAESPFKRAYTIPTRARYR